MTTRWKGRSSRSSTIQEQQLKLQELEMLLSQRDDTVADLEKKLSVQLQMVKKLHRERNELRSKNASLVCKLAEVSRKHSVAASNNTTPPSFHR